MQNYNATVWLPVHPGLAVLWGQVTTAIQYEKNRNLLIKKRESEKHSRPDHWSRKRWTTKIMKSLGFYAHYKLAKIQASIPTRQVQNTSQVITLNRKHSWTGKRWGLLRTFKIKYVMSQQAVNYSAVQYKYSIPYVAISAEYDIIARGQNIAFSVC